MRSSLLLSSSASALAACRAASSLLSFCLAILAKADWISLECLSFPAMAGWVGRLPVLDPKGC
eukprot:14708976-Heterocapsa_arctica.AAC.1